MKYSLDLDRFRLPRVPRELMRYTNGSDDFEAFLLSGAEVAIMLDLAARKYGGKSIDEFSRVLDFGCGCGRVLRFLQPQGVLTGIDINRQLIEYCNRAYPGTTFVQNDLRPPLPFGDGSFDLIYSFSVFSHLRLDAEQEWLEELHRVGDEGCLYLLTVQGDWFIEQVLGDEADEARREGFYFHRVHGERLGAELDFPEYYESSYHTSGYVRRQWSSFFEIVDVIKGDDPSRYLFDDIAFAPNGPVPLLRPMGQDLVVARKRTAAGAT